MLDRTVMFNALVETSLNQVGERVYCIVGPNGAGKSRLLEEVRSYVSGSRVKSRDATLPSTSQSIKCLILPASRNFQPTQNSLHQMNGPLGTEVDPFVLISQSQINNTIDKTASMFQTWGAMVSLQTIESRDKADKADYDNRLLEWANKEDCQNHVKPSKPKSSKTETLSLLSDILNRKIVHRDDFVGEIETSEPFGIQLEDRVVSLDRMSDGEKQLFMLISFLTARASNRAILLIDEPELHLNEAKADEVWSAIENHLPNAVFVYATHSMSFATRDAVKILMSIDMNGKLDIIDRNRTMPSILMREMVGARVRLLRTKFPIIFCEDRSSKNFITDLMTDYKVEIVKLPGRGPVIDASKQQAGWNKILSEPVIRCGVVDRDEMIDEEVIEFENDYQNIIVLPFNEIESLLFNYELLRYFICRHGIQEQTFRDGYSAIIDNATKSLAKVAVSKHTRRLCLRSFPEISVNHTPDEFRSVDLKPMDRIKSDIEARTRVILQARSTNDFDAIAKLFPGKEMYNQFASQSKRRFGVSLQEDPAMQYQSMRNDVELRAFITSLRQSIYIRNRIKSALQL